MISFDTHRTLSQSEMNKCMSYIHVYICAFHLKISSFFSVRVSSFNSYVFVMFTSVTFTLFSCLSIFLIILQIFGMKCSWFRIYYFPKNKEFLILDKEVREIYFLPISFYFFLLSVTLRRHLQCQTISTHPTPWRIIIW